MTDNQFDLIIVGIGPAGLTAAIYAQRMGLKVVVFGNTPGGNLYMVESLMNYPGFPGGIAGTQFGVSTYQQAQQEGAVIPLTLIGELNTADNRFIGTDEYGKQYAAPAAILATGRKPKTLDVPNANKPGMYFLFLRFRD